MRFSDRFKEFLSESGLSSKQFVAKTGLGINTPTYWMRTDSDSKIRLESIVKFARAFPDYDLIKLFPSLKEVSNLTRCNSNNESNK